MVSAKTSQLIKIGKRGQNTNVNKERREKKMMEKGQKEGGKWIVERKEGEKWMEGRKEKRGNRETEYYKQKIKYVDIYFFS